MNYNQSDEVNIYRTQIEKFPLLNFEEEIGLGKQIKAGSTKALEKLISSNLRFVVYIAKGYTNQGSSLGDLISAGNEGLIKAAEKYDYERGIHFISYAVWHIKQRIVNEISEKSRTIRLPRNRSRKLSRIEEVKKDFHKKAGYYPNISEISEETGIPEEEINLLLSQSNTVSIESPITEDSDITFELPDDRYVPDTEVVKDNSSNNIKDFIYATLKGRELDVIVSRFGLDGRETETLKEIGKRYHVVPEMIRKDEKAAMRKLRVKKINGRSLIDYLK